MTDSFSVWHKRVAVVTALCGVVSGCKSGGGDAVVISEFVASNGNGITDGDGETSDWIELFNAGQNNVNLEGWRLTDNPNEPWRWTFPPTELEPGQYVVVFASGKAQNPSDSELHTAFRLKGSADYLALLRPNGRVAHEFAPYPEQQNDVSFGVGSDGVTGFLQTPTPNAPNSPSVRKNKDTKSKNGSGE